jgi:hypothetical protein
MLLLTIKPDWAGIMVHYLPEVDGVHMSLYSPVHLQFVDVDGRGIEAMLTDTGGWILG